mmetsp:Transcript_35532/g.78831  ORF Transcript_35532/g.78831 Transcript_35532/m.78831 type:complete len:272 (+) Transcript_35532:1343-2158(+)
MQCVLDIRPVEVDLCPVLHAGVVRRLIRPVITAALSPPHTGAQGTAAGCTLFLCYMLLPAATRLVPGCLAGCCSEGLCALHTCGDALACCSSYAQPRRAVGPSEQVAQPRSLPPGSGGQAVVRDNVVDVYAAHLLIGLVAEVVTQLHTALGIIMVRVRVQGVALGKVAVLPDALEALVTDEGVRPPVVHGALIVLDGISPGIAQCQALNRQILQAQLQLPAHLIRLKASAGSSSSAVGGLGQRWAGSAGLLHAVVVSQHLAGQLWYIVTSV